MSSKGLANYQFWLPVDLKDDLERVARKKNCDMSEIVREAISEKIESLKKDPVEKK